MLPVLRANLISAALEALRKSSERPAAHSADMSVSTSPTDSAARDGPASEGFIYRTRGGISGLALMRPPSGESKGQALDCFA